MTEPLDVPFHWLSAVADFLSFGIMCAVPSHLFINILLPFSKRKTVKWRKWNGMNWETSAPFFHWQQWAILIHAFRKALSLGMSECECTCEIHLHRHIEIVAVWGATFWNIRRQILDSRTLFDCKSPDVLRTVYWAPGNRSTINIFNRIRVHGNPIQFVDNSVSKQTIRFGTLFSASPK